MSDPTRSPGQHGEAGHHKHHNHHAEAAPAKPGYPEHPEMAHGAPVVDQTSYVHRARPEHHEAHTWHEAHAGHDKHAGHSVEGFRRKFWVSLVLTVPTLLWGHMLQRGLGYMAPHFPGSQWIPPLFGTAVFLYGGWVFVEGAGRELRDRLPGMMTLIALAISVAFVFSLVVTLGYAGMPLWEELATLVTIMLLGHWIEMRSVAQASGALRELAKLLPATAERIVGEQTEEVPVAALREGDMVLVRPAHGYRPTASCAAA